MEAVHSGVYYGMHAQKLALQRELTKPPRLRGCRGGLKAIAATHESREPRARLVPERSTVLASSVLSGQYFPDFADASGNICQQRPGLARGDAGLSGSSYIVYRQLDGRLEPGGSAGTRRSQNQRAFDAIRNAGDDREAQPAAVGARARALEAGCQTVQRFGSQTGVLRLRRSSCPSGVSVTSTGVASEP